MTASTRIIITVLAAGVVTSALTACGDGDSSSSSTESVPKGPAAITPDMTQAEALGKVFPKPVPIEGSSKGAQKAIDAGERACRGKTPVEVYDEFIAEARGAGTLNEGQESLLAELPQIEKKTHGSPSFAAGQLAAGVYEATLPEEDARSGYQGCVYALAVQLRKELTQEQGKKQG